MFMDCVMRVEYCFDFLKFIFSAYKYVEVGELIVCV